MIIDYGKESCDERNTHPIDRSGNRHETLLHSFRDINPHNWAQSKRVDESHEDINQAYSNFDSGAIIL